MMALWHSRVPAQCQDIEGEAAKWNSAIFSLLFTPVLFTAQRVKVSPVKKGLPVKV